MDPMTCPSKRLAEESACYGCPSEIGGSLERERRADFSHPIFPSRDARASCFNPRSAWSSRRHAALPQLPRSKVLSRYFSPGRPEVAFTGITVQDLAQPGLLAEGHDRRRNPRYLCGGHAQLTLVPSNGAVLVGRLRNLGLGGCFVEVGSPLEVGTRTEVLVRANMLCFRAMSLVRAVRKCSGLGLEFIRLSAGGHSALSELIVDLRRLQALLNNARAGTRLIAPGQSAQMLLDRFHAEPVRGGKPAFLPPVGEVLGPERPAAARCRSILEFHPAANVLDLFV